MFNLKFIQYAIFSTPPYVLISKKTTRLTLSLRLIEKAPIRHFTKDLSRFDYCTYKVD